MALKYELENLEGVDDAVKGLYTEVNGKFILDVEGIDTGEELKRALSSERNLRKEAERNLSEFRTEAQQKVEEEAKKKGDFEQLYNSSQSTLDQVKGELSSLRGQIATEKKQAAATKIATELADGHNADLLATFVQTRLQHTDDGLKVLDQAGQLSVASLDDLKQEIAGDARYSALIRGNQSSGGGSAGAGNGGGAAEKVVSREQFDAMNHDQRMTFVKDGGSVSEA